MAVRAACRHCGAMGLAGDKVDRAGGGGAKSGAVGVVAHRVVLGIVPKGGHSVAVVIPHDNFVTVAGDVTAGAGGADRFHEFIHQATVIRLLLIGIVVVLIAGDGLGAGEAN